MIIDQQGTSKISINNPFLQFLSSYTSHFLYDWNVPSMCVVLCLIAFLCHYLFCLGSAWESLFIFLPLLIPLGLTLLTILDPFWYALLLKKIWIYFDPPEPKRQYHLKFQNSFTPLKPLLRSWRRKIGSRFRPIDNWPKENMQSFINQGNETRSREF